MRAQQHRLIAGQVGLRRQHVEALRAGNARRGFQREGGNAGGGELLQCFGIEGVEHADQHGAGFQLGLLIGAGTAYFENDVGP